MWPAWLAEYDYELPDARIARAPVEPRDASRLLFLDRRSGARRHHRFAELPDLLQPGDCLVVNETRVLRARLFTRLERTGRRIEVLLSHPCASEPAPALAPTQDDRESHLDDQSHVEKDPHLDDESHVEKDPHLDNELHGGKPHLDRERHLSSVAEPSDPADWVAILGPARRLQEGDLLRLEGGEGAFRVVARIERERWRIRPQADPIAMMEAVGHLPIPPYLRRDDRDEDRDWYQTVFAERAGAIAAPTAGLHFTKPVLERANASGIRLARIVLHVGPGTFLPVRAATQDEHRVLPERYSISEDAARFLRETRAQGQRVVAVGTTVVRALETIARVSPVALAGSGWTDLTIRPGHQFRAIQGLVTNFHLPRSSLLLLVSAFAGRQRILGAYREAIETGYRFYSYGDAMLIL